MVEDSVKMLFPYISNTICLCLPKTYYFVNADKTCRSKAEVCEKNFHQLRSEVQKSV